MQFNKWGHIYLACQSPGVVNGWKVRLNSQLEAYAGGMVKTGWQSHWHKHPGVRSGDQLTIGERAADRMRNMMGSWPFVFIFFGIMITWAVINSVFYLGGQNGKHGFDPYPYILLNLFLSMLAGVQAAALLIAAKRADAIASEIALHTEKNTDDLKVLLYENTELTKVVKRNTDLLEEIHRHVAMLAPEAGPFHPGEEPSH